MVSLCCLRGIFLVAILDYVRDVVDGLVNVCSIV